MTGRRVTWWIAVLFAAGSACFLVAPFPGFLQLVGPVADGVVFFVGSLLFTSAAAVQWLQTINADGGRRLRVVTFEPHRLDWWSAGVQLLGTLFFNATTFRALQTGLDSPSYDQVVWRPDALGSVCFLVSGYLAYVEVTGSLLGHPRRTMESAIASVNLLGCVAFGISAVAAYVVPTTGSEINVSSVNTFTKVSFIRAETFQSIVRTSSPRSYGRTSRNARP